MAFRREENPVLFSVRKGKERKGEEEEEEHKEENVREQIIELLMEYDLGI